MATAAVAAVHTHGVRFVKLSYFTIERKLSNANLQIACLTDRTIDRIAKQAGRQAGSQADKTKCDSPIEY